MMTAMMFLSITPNDCKYKIGVDQMNCRIKIK
jgi:hypothetical protein